MQNTNEHLRKTRQWAYMCVLPSSDWTNTQAVSTGRNGRARESLRTLHNRVQARYYQQTERTTEDLDRAERTNKDQPCVSLASDRDRMVGAGVGLRAYLRGSLHTEMVWAGAPFSASVSLGRKARSECICKRTRPMCRAVEQVWKRELEMLTNINVLKRLYVF